MATISIVVTCVVLVGVNVYILVRDYFDKENMMLWVRRRVKRVSDDLFHMNQDIEAIKRDMDALRIDIVGLKSGSKNNINMDTINAKMDHIENKTELALMSVQTIQDNFLQILDAKENNL